MQLCEDFRSQRVRASVVRLDDQLDCAWPVLGEPEVCPHPPDAAAEPGPAGWVLGIAQDSEQEMLRADAVAAQCVGFLGGQVEPPLGEHGLAGQRVPATDAVLPPPGPSTG